jgi:hypothetical protein
LKYCGIPQTTPTEDAVKLNKLGYTVERVELKIDGMYQVQDSLHHRKYIVLSTSRKSEAVRATTDVPGDNAECCFVSEISI